MWIQQVDSDLAGIRGQYRKFGDNGARRADREVRCSASIGRSRCALMRSEDWQRRPCGPAVTAMEYPERGWVGGIKSLSERHTCEPAATYLRRETQRDELAGGHRYLGPRRATIVAFSTVAKSAACGHIHSWAVCPPGQRLMCPSQPCLLPGGAAARCSGQWNAMSCHHHRWHIDHWLGRVVWKGRKGGRLLNHLA